MTDYHSNHEATCHQCLLENLMSQTLDSTAISDVGRPHRGYRKGWDATKNHRTGVKETFALPQKLLLTSEDFAYWEAEMANRMAPTSLAVYRATIGTGLRGLTCEHGGWGSGVPDAASGLTVPVGSLDVQHRVASDVDNSSDRIGFKLSVCQKSLSLSLKHAYAHGKIQLPPVCPVDRIVLDLAASQTGRHWSTNWTAVNDMQTYQSHLDHLFEAAALWNLDLAEWEILGFESQLPTLYEIEQTGLHLSSEDLESRLAIARGAFLRRFGSPVNDPDWMHSMLTDALKSSLQHNPTYHKAATEQQRVEVRGAMRSFLRGFVTRWTRRPAIEQTVEAFQAEILAFQKFMNDAHSECFQ